MTVKVSLDGSRFSLRRERDGQGDAGALYILDPKTGKAKKDSKWGDIEIGFSVYCGAWRTSTYDADTYWITTPVTSILEVNRDRTRVKFKTGNSVYIAEAI